MSDRMPEDLPVTKCINVMVGITRSKVISDNASADSRPTTIIYKNVYNLQTDFFGGDIFN